MPNYNSITRVGVDLGQSVMQVHAIDCADSVVVARQLQRADFAEWCRRLPKGCVVAMEACTSSHYWGRELAASGLDVRLMSPSFVVPYRMAGATGKNDANDAEAICEAAGRPRMRFVPVKSSEQQSWLAVHHLRDGYIRERVACMNRTRAVLAEFGVLMPRAPKKFLDHVLSILAERRHELTPLTRMSLRRSCSHFRAIQRQIVWCDRQIAKHAGADINAKRALRVCGVGVLGASALAAGLGNLSQFDNGRQFSAWLGLVPRQHSSGGKQRLGHVTRRGDAYLRKLLVVGARNALFSAPVRNDDVSRWAVQLRARIGWPKAAVALANRNARTLWRMLSQPNEAR
jgi:transposase